MKTRLNFLQNKRFHGLGIAAAIGFVCALYPASPVLSQTVGANTAEAIGERVEAYLESIDMLEAQFLQAAPDGTITSGRFVLDRPGRLRFDYDTPAEDFIVADGRFLYFWDSDLQQQASIPIGDTLADFILRENISIGDTLTISEAFEDEDTLRVTLYQTASPGSGSLTLLLRKDPLKLLKWRVKDAQGRMTEVSLSNIKTPSKVDPSLFTFVPPTRGALNE